jgi:hypothetical protein
MGRNGKSGQSELALGHLKLMFHCGVYAPAKPQDAAVSIGTTDNAVIPKERNGMLSHVRATSQAYESFQAGGFLHFLHFPLWGGGFNTDGTQGRVAPQALPKWYY